MSNADIIFNYIKDLPNDADYLSVAFSYDNLQNGSPWGFDNNNENINPQVVYEKFLEQYKTNPIMNAHVKVYKLAKGYDEYPIIIETSDFKRPSRIMSEAFKLAGAHYDELGLYTNYINKHNQDLAQFTELLANGFEGSLGIYNTSESNVFLVNGKQYPLFRLRAKDVLPLLNHFDYLVKDIDGRFRKVADFPTIEEFLINQRKIASGKGIAIHIKK